MAVGVKVWWCLEIKKNVEQTRMGDWSDLLFSNSANASSLPEKPVRASPFVRLWSGFTASQLQLCLGFGRVAFAATIDLWPLIQTPSQYWIHSFCLMFIGLLLLLLKLPIFHWHNQNVLQKFLRSKKRCECISHSMTLMIASGWHSSTFEAYAIVT